MLKALKSEQKKWWKKSDPTLQTLIDKLEQMIRNEQINKDHF